MGLAYKSISATGANAALPHYTPKKSAAHMIERDTPYLKYVVHINSTILSQIDLSEVILVDSIEMGRVTPRGLCISADLLLSRVKHSHGFCRAT